MTTAFELALDYLLRNEGKDFTNDPVDSGGATKFGITLRAYQNYTGKSLTPEDIKNLTLDDAELFYRVNFWEPLRCPLMKDIGITIAVFDTAVLYGISTTVRLTQQALNVVARTELLKVDGISGMKTVNILNSTPRPAFLEALHQMILARICAVIAQAPKNERFRKGWTLRANRLLTLKDSGGSIGLS